ncbi:hypothetical protein RHODO2019_10910 [Rhodococcus antarcticus]|uniref:Phage-related protein n=1 Tax=Rhodococcus antarcticus TaxID=2987751 RepID=A0ABY6NWF1_9NOCA|nr:hypothetical protein [Rhodococcus antarcticus]UZJ23717.1 hypothetical protein RHODO2019_10910 [Rhodococcus antarcticus]
MPGSAIIGRVAVKVLPDTTDFRKDAERKLTVLERQLQPVKVPTKIDMSGASKEFLEELRKINARNRALDSRKIRFQTKISTDGMRDEIVKARRKLETLAQQQKIKFAVDIASIETNSAVDVKLEITKASEEEFKKRLDHVISKNSPQEIEVKLDLRNRSVLATEAALAALTRRRTVNVKPLIDKKALASVVTALAALSGARVLNNWLSAAKDFGRNLDKTVPKIAAMSSGLLGLGALLLTSVSNVAAFGGGLAAIGGIALALPGLFAGIGIGVGVMVAVFKDFNKVLPEVKGKLADLQDRMSAEFWKGAEGPIRNMIDSLLPKFSDGLASTSSAMGLFFANLSDSMTKALGPRLAGMFSSLTQSINIAAGGTDVFAGVMAKLGTVGASYLPRLAQYVNDVASRFDTWLGATEGDSRLTGFIDQGIQALNDLAGVIFQLGRIFGGVFKAAEAAGGSTLGILRDTLQSVADVVNSPAFQAGLVGVFTAAHVAMGNIANISGPAVKDLFLTIGKLLETLLPIVGTVLGTLAEGIATALAQPEVGNGLIVMFQGIQNAVTALLPAFGPLGLAIGALAPVIGMIAQVLGPMLATFFTILSDVVVQLASPIQALVQVLGGALNQVLTALAPVISQVVGAFVSLLEGGVIPAVITAVNTLVPVIELLAPIIGDLLVTAITSLTPILPALVAAFVPLITILAQAAAEILPQLAPLFPILADAITRVLVAVTPLIAPLTTLLTSIILPLIPVVITLATSIASVLATAFEKLVPVLMPIVAALQELWNVVGPILIPILQFLAQVLIDTVMTAINGVINVVNGVVSIFKGLIDFVVGVFTGDWERAWNGIKEFFSGLWDLIVGIIQLAMTVGVLGVVKKGLTLIKGLWKGGWDAVKAVFTTVWDDIVSAFGRYMSTIKAAPGQALSALKTLFYDAWTAISTGLRIVWDEIIAFFSGYISSVVGFVTSLPGRFRSGLSGLRSSLGGTIRSAWDDAVAAVQLGVEAAVNFVRSLPSKAASALSNLSGALTGAGRALIQGFINGIKGMFGSVAGTLSDLTSKLTSWKGPYELDRVLLEPTGALIINGFINGLESRYDAVRKSLGGLTSDIGNTDIAVPNVNGLSAARARAMASVNGSLAPAGAGSSRTLNYYAAQNSSLAEEDLFAAAGRARMVSW